LGQPASNQKKTVVPEPMINAVEPDGVETGIAEKNLQTRLGGGIVVHHVGHVFPD
jgi:hypothetical protein